MHKNTNKYAPPPWEWKCASPGEMSWKCCNFVGGLYIFLVRIKKSPGESKPKPMLPGGRKNNAVYKYAPPGEKRRLETILQG